MTIPLVATNRINTPEVAEAMADASQACVDIADLQAAASRLIAEATGAEAGYVASGASACLLIGAAACVTGLGSLFHLHFTDRVVTDARLAEDADHERLRALHTALLARGCYFYAGRLGFLSTAHTEADIDYMLEAVATELGG